STRTDVPVWTLIRLEAHRFAGLHRHCGFNGEDPESFILSFEKDITLIHGFNGAGKTALLSAIVWCLTAKALRSQQMPVEVHQPMPIEREEPGQLMQDETQQSVPALPPVVPLPSGDDLKHLKDEPKTDTWVRLTFVNKKTGETCT